jgi:hypothetical protein
LAQRSEAASEGLIRQMRIAAVVANSISTRARAPTSGIPHDCHPKRSRGRVDAPRNRNSRDSLERGSESFNVQPYPISNDEMSKEEEISHESEYTTRPFSSEARAV